MTPDGIFLDSSHINLKGIVTFESFAPDFQTAYEQAFGNASMTAKDDVAGSWATAITRGLSRMPPPAVRLSL